MDPSVGTIVTIILSVIALIMTVFLALRSDRAAQQRRLEDTLNEVVTKRMDTIFEVLKDHTNRITSSELNHAQLLGYLKGRGVLRNDSGENEALT